MCLEDGGDEEELAAAGQIPQQQLDGMHHVFRPKQIDKKPAIQIILTIDRVKRNSGK